MNGTQEAIMSEIRAAAAVRRVSIRELARRIDADYSTLRRYLAGERAMDISVLYRIAAVLGVPGSEIVKAGEDRARADSLEAHVRAVTGDETDVTETLRIVSGESTDSNDSVAPPGSARGTRAGGAGPQ